VINAVLFKNKNDDGIHWAKYYTPFSVAGFALTITAICFKSYKGSITYYKQQIECAINEWESGICKMNVFKKHEYAVVFRSHLASLDEFKNITTSIGLLMKLLQQVYSNG
ncbi:hypothetical protein J3R82DRAFT_2817, partial [Butyriboletus roseoflavus]